jgi:uncharacterized 2Fe-2S/4Fe-4S cluster protein (DUF4445 family)
MHAVPTPWIRTVSLSAPTLLDNTADADRLVNALKARLDTDIIDVDLELVRILPDLLRKQQYRVRCVLFKNRRSWRLIGITPAEDPDPIAGLAVDLGTTRIVLRLLDFKTGGILAESAIDNPQKVAGPDILTRIHYADQPGGLQKLNHLIITALNAAIAKLCRSGRTAPKNIYALSIAGNTTMTHFFMGLNPHYIIREPYIPAINTPDVLKARALGLIVNPLAEVLIFPNIGSYFGGDLIAGILFSKIYRQEETSILVDVGTNAEVVLGNRNWLIGCAGAAGPALEGGVTRMGTTAAPGVIDKVRIDPDSHEFELHTIDGLPPKGICGSGIIDLAAQLFLAGMIDIRGKLVPEICGGRLKEIDARLHLVVATADQSASGEDLTISQADFDSLIRSKAAMYTILETITASVGIALKDLSSFYVAGTFGAFIDPRSAISIGMLPDLPLERYVPMGNSSLEGATLALQSENCLAEIDTIREGITYLELNVNQEFMNRFNAARFLPHTDPALFPSVKTRPKP